MKTLRDHRVNVPVAGHYSVASGAGAILTSVYSVIVPVKSDVQLLGDVLFSLSGLLLRPSAQLDQVPQASLFTSTLGL